MAAKSCAERVAENESTFRDANEQLREVFEQAEEPSEARLPFLCECASTRCTQVVLLSLEEYAEVRQYPARFLTAPDHQKPDTEVVVREERRYQVVEKRGEAAAIAARFFSPGRTHNVPRFRLQILDARRDIRVFSKLSNPPTVLAT